MIVRAELARGPMAALLLLMSPPVAAAPRTHVVVIDKMRFSPSPSNMKVGDVLVWENRDMFRHTASAADGTFNVDLKPGGKANMILGKTGTIAYSCKYHPGMRSALKVSK